MASRREIVRGYRGAVTVSAVILAIAAYHYFRLFESFNAAYVLEGGTYVASGAPFNEAYRYMDWIVTVPLLVAELVLVLGLGRDERRSLLTKLIVASALMIGFGYPGELTTDASVQWLWWAAGMIPFVYILYVLFGEVSQRIAAEDGQVQGLLRLLRGVLAGTWLFYGSPTCSRSCSETPPWR